ncbi:MAG: glycosyltransferase family 9 protein [Thermodesulfobacteriota bacterium]
MVSFSSGEFSDIESILIIHQGAIGDFILALPALASLRKAFPNARCVIMGYPRIIQLVHKRIYADEIVSVDQKGMATFFVQDGSLDLSLSQFFQAFDLIVPFGKGYEGVLIKNLKRVAKGLILPISSFPRWDEGVHITDHLMGQLKRYGISTFDSIPRLYLNDEDRSWARAFWKSKGIHPEGISKVLLIHPGSGSKRKVWPLKKILSLINQIKSRTENKLLIILGPAEGEEINRAFEVIEDHRIIPVRGLSLIQLASVMEGCKVFIGHDSGISHMASSLDLPTLVLFGPTDPRVWAPRGEKVEIIRREMPCSPCAEERFFLCKEPDCLKGIEVEEVLKGLVRLGVIL